MSKIGKRAILILLALPIVINVMAQEKIVQTAGRTQLGEFAPKFAELNDDVLFGEVSAAEKFAAENKNTYGALASLELAQQFVDSNCRRSGHFTPSERF